MWGVEFVVWDNGGGFVVVLTSFCLGNFEVFFELALLGSFIPVPSHYYGYD